MARMHADELEIDEALVRRLLAEQFPEWADLPLSPVEPGGTVNAIFRLGASDQIADNAVITINGGSFGDPATIAAPTNPGSIDTVDTVIVNGGNFLSSRNLSGMTVSTLLKVTAGTALAQRGGAINAGAVEITGGAVSLDGGTTTVGNESRLNIGSGGLVMTGGVINFNNGPSPLTSASAGSILNLGGNVVSFGTTSFVRVSTVVGPKAVVDLNGVGRTFDVTGAMTIAPNAMLVPFCCSILLFDDLCCPMVLLNITLQPRHPEADLPPGRLSQPEGSLKAALKAHLRAPAALCSRREAIQRRLAELAVEIRRPEARLGARGPPV